MNGHHSSSWVIARKELLEIIRDKRTLVSLLLFPVLFYPAVLLLITQVGSVQIAKMEEEPSRIGLSAQAFDAIGESIQKEGFQWSVGVWDPADVPMARVDALLEIESDFEHNLRGRKTAQLTVIYDETAERSRRAQAALEEALNEWRKEQ